VGERPVAIRKFVASDPSGDTRGQFIEEAHVLGELMHPGLPSLQDMFDHEGGHYLVFEHIGGPPLSDLAPMRPDDAVRHVEQVLDILEFLEHQKLLLEDPSPDNLILESETRVRVSRLSFLRPNTRPHGDASCYLAPEQQGGLQTDNALVYTVGALLHALMSGMVPPPALHRLLGSAPLPSPAIRNPQVSAALNTVLDKMLEPMSGKRYARMAEALKALHAASRQVGHSTLLKAHAGVVAAPGAHPAVVPAPAAAAARSKHTAPPPPELQVRVGRADRKKEQSSELRCEKCGAALTQGPLCADCMAALQQPEPAEQPRPPDLPAQHAVPHGGSGPGATAKAPWIGRFRRLPAPAPPSILLGPMVLKSDKVRSDVPIAIASWRPSDLEFDTTTWLDPGHPVHLHLPWHQDGKKAGEANLRLVPLRLLVTVDHWRYTVLVPDDAPIEIFQYLQQFWRKSRERMVRQDPRVPCHFRVRSSQLPWFEAVAADISINGLAVRADHPLTVGRIVDLQWDFDDFRFPPTQGRCEVRWCMYEPEGQVRLGLRLLEMSEKHRLILSHFVNEQKAGNPSTR
jgi:hypothetical protein